MKYDKFMGILKEIDSLLDLSKDNIVEKIKAELQKKRFRFMSRVGKE